MSELIVDVLTAQTLSKDYYCDPIVIPEERRLTTFFNSIPKFVTDDDREILRARLLDKANFDDFFTGYPYDTTRVSPRILSEQIKKYYNVQYRCIPKYKLIETIKTPNTGPDDWNMGYRTIYTYKDVRTGQIIKLDYKKNGKGYYEQSGGKRKYYKKFSKKYKKGRKSQKKSRNKTIKYSK